MKNKSSLKTKFLAILCAGTTFLAPFTFTGCENFDINNLFSGDRQPQVEDKSDVDDNETDLDNNNDKENPPQQSEEENQGDKQEESGDKQEEENPEEDKPIEDEPTIDYFKTYTKDTPQFQQAFASLEQGIQPLLASKSYTINIRGLDESVNGRYKFNDEMNMFEYKTIDHKEDYNVDNLCYDDGHYIIYKDDQDKSYYRLVRDNPISSINGRTGVVTHEYRKWYKENENLENLKKFQKLKDMAFLTEQTGIDVNSLQPVSMSQGKFTFEDKNGKQVHLYANFYGTSDGFLTFVTDDNASIEVEKFNCTNINLPEEKIVIDRSYEVDAEEFQRKFDKVMQSVNENKNFTMEKIDVGNELNYLKIDGNIYYVERPNCACYVINDKDGNYLYNFHKPSEEEKIKYNLPDDEIWIRSTNDDYADFTVVTDASYMFNEAKTLKFSKEDYDYDTKEFVNKFDKNITYRVASVSEDGIKYTKRFSTTSYSVTLTDVGTTKVEEPEYYYNENSRKIVDNREKQSEEVGSEETQNPVEALSEIAAQNKALELQILEEEKARQQLLRALNANREADKAGAAYEKPRKQFVDDKTYYKNAEGRIKSR